jgi:hypothetical protein
MLQVLSLNAAPPVIVTPESMLNPSSSQPMGDRGFISDDEKVNIPLVPLYTNKFAAAVPLD